MEDIQEIRPDGKKNTEYSLLNALISLALISLLMILDGMEQNAQHSEFGNVIGLTCGLTLVPLLSKKQPLWHTVLVGVGLLALRLILSYPFHLVLVRN
jgi:hypothetical protein